MSPRVGSVGILVGNEADLPSLERCAARLERYGIEHEVEVRDVHASPESVSEYAGTARERGLAAQILALSDSELAERLAS